MSNPDPKGGGWQGAKPLQLFATLAVGCLLYFVLPRFAPIPDAKIFGGTATAKASAKPADKGAKAATTCGLPCPRMSGPQDPRKSV